MSTRTITYTVKVDAEGAKKGAKDMKITMRSMSQDSAKAEASMDKLGKSIGNKFAKHVEVAEDKTKSLANSLRQGFRDSDKARKNFNLLSNEYKLLSSRVGRNADQQEQLNALYRLGSNATLTQRKATLKLVKAYQLQRAAGSTVQKSYRGMRGQMQNFGYQMQDVAVQMQMGTNAMTIFSQQGSQLAAGFGPTGAVIGAGIAFTGMIGSLLLPALFQGDKAVKKLTESLKELAKSTGLTKEESELLILTEKESIKSAEKSLAKLKEQREETEKNNKQAMRRLRIGQDSRYNDGKTTKVIEKYNKELLENTVQQQEQSRIIKEGSKNMDIYRAAVGQGTDEQKEWAESNKDITESLASQVEQIGLSNSQLLELTKTQQLKTLADQGASDVAITAAALNADALINAAKKIESDQAATKALAEKSKAEAEANKAEAKAIRLRNKELAAESKAKAKALSIQNEALAAERELLNLRAGLTDSGKLDQLRAQYEEEKSLLAGHKDELEALEQNYERDRLQVSSTAWEKYLDGIKSASMDFEKLSEDMLQGSVEGLSDGIANAIVNADSLGDAFKNTFKAVATAGISALIQMGVQRLIFSTLDTGLKAKEVVAHTSGEAAKTQATMAAKVTEMAATKAIYVLNVYGRGMAEATLGSLNAAASTAAIPVIGPALAPAAAAAFMSFGTATTGAAVGFAGAFDKGGVIPQGMTGIVSEYGDELVDGMLVKGKAGGTRVTGREDTAKIMNNSGGNNTFNITSSGNVSPDAIARAVARSLKKPNKVLDTMVYDSVTRGSKNRGKRFA